MSLHLPEAGASNGQLNFGRKPPAVDYKMPLLQDNTSELVAESWKVLLSSVSVAAFHNSSSLDISLDVPAAVSMLSSFALGLPFPAAKAVSVHIQGDEGEPDEIDPFIDCEKRENLPDININLAGYDITLTWEDYAVLVPDRFGEHDLCFVPIWGMEHNDAAMLGLPVLRRFDLFFDLDNGELGCTSSLHLDDDATNTLLIVIHRPEQRLLSMYDA